MAFKISVDKNKCIGCGACTSCDNFEMDSEGKAKPKQATVNEEGCNKEAADICPVGAIKVIKA